MPDMTDLYKFLGHAVGAVIVFAFLSLVYYLKH